MEYIHQLGGMSYLGVFVVSLLANLVIPFPEEVTLISLGYLAGTGVFHLVFIIPISMIGLFLSDLMVYTLSYKGSRFTQAVYNKMFAERFDFLHGLEGDRLERVIVFSRFLIYFRFLAPFLSGYYKLKFKTFLFHEMVSLSVYVTLTVGAGYFLRNRLEQVLSGVGIVQNVILGIVFIILAITFFKGLKKHVMKKMHLEMLEK